MNKLNLQLNSLVFKIIVTLSILNFVQYNKCHSKQKNDNTGIKALYDSAKTFYRITDYNKAENHFYRVLELKNKTNKDYNPEYFKVYNWLGLIHKKQGNLQKAIRFYTKALNHTSDDFYKSLIHNNLANVFTLTGDYSKALIYYKNSLSILIKSNKEDKHQRIANNYLNQSIVYYKSSQFDLALEYNLKSIKISVENKLKIDGDSYYNCGLIYKDLKKLNKSEYYFKKAIQIYTNEYGPYHHMTGLSYMSYAGTITKKGNLNMGLNIYHKSLNILLNTLGNKHHFTSYCFMDIGNLFYQKGDYPKALYYFQKSLIAKIQTFNDTCFYNLPEKETNPDIYLIDILNAKAKALEKLAEDKKIKISEKEGNLKAALKTLELNVKYIEQLRTGYLYENSKLQLASKEHDTYTSIVQIAYSLYFCTRELKYLKTAFKHAEYGKYAILRDLKNEEKAKKTASIPERFIKEEQNIKEKISNLRVQVENEIKQQQPDNLRIEKYNKEIFCFSKKLDSLMHKLENNFPAYYKQKYSNFVASISETQDFIKSKEALVEYVLSKNSLYTFVVTKDTLMFIKQNIDNNFNNSLEFFKRFLHNEYSLRYDSFRISAFQLYKNLLLPIENVLEGKELLIIPDQKLSVISFDALTYKPYNKEETANFRNEPYLLRKYAISYAFSATLYKDNQEKNSNKELNFLGIAPSYKNSKDSLEHLPLGIKNVKKLSWLTLGKSLTKEKATKEKFKELSPEYDIIHFYAHGFEDTLNPSNSRICLTTIDTLKENNLYAWEVYNMQLNAKLVVLASCHSGSGKISKGEGVMSIARNFIQAGSQSIILSLWSAAYNPTNKILNSFYNNLFKGKSKREALRIAKLKYLENTDSYNAQPRFWAGIILNGNPQALYKYWYLKKIAFLLGIVVLCIVIFKSKKRFLKSS